MKRHIFPLLTLGALLSSCVNSTSSSITYCPCFTASSIPSGLNLVEVQQIRHILNTGFGSLPVKISSVDELNAFKKEHPYLDINGGEPLFNEFNMVILPIWYSKYSLNFLLFYAALKDETIEFNYRFDSFNHDDDLTQDLFVYKISKTIPFETIKVSYTAFHYCQEGQTQYATSCYCN